MMVHDKQQVAETNTAPTAESTTQSKSELFDCVAHDVDVDNDVDLDAPTQPMIFVEWM
jgi:hypothetical protein